MPNNKVMNIPIPANNLFAHLYHIFIYLIEVFGEIVSIDKITWIKGLISVLQVYLLTNNY